MAYQRDSREWPEAAGIEARCRLVRFRVLEMGLDRKLRRHRRVEERETIPELVLHVVIGGWRRRDRRRTRWRRPLFFREKSERDSGEKEEEMGKKEKWARLIRLGPYIEFERRARISSHKFKGQDLKTEI